MNPMIRENTNDPWREVSWDEAIQYSAKRFKEIQAKYLSKSEMSTDIKANNMYLNMLIDQMNDPEISILPGLADMPPGSPIGCVR